MNAARRPALALALPRLAAVLEAAGFAVTAPPLPALQWLAARGRPVPTWSGDWRAWLLSLFGPGAEALRRFPAGPSLRALVGGRPAAGCWACAEPVHLTTALDHLRLAPRTQLELPANEGRALAASLDVALAGSGYSLRWSDRGVWLLGCASSVECDTVEPAQAEGRDVRDCLPSGRDGAGIRRLTNELQMLLHEHPVNAARAARGLPVVNSIWLWGFGEACEPAAAPLPVLLSDDLWLAGLWRLHGSEARPLGDVSRVLAGAPALLIAAADAGVDPRAQLHRWESGLAAPLVAALAQARIGTAEVLLGTVAYRVTQAARFAVWRRPRPWSQLLQQ
jgi:hypothetical protein